MTTAALIGEATPEQIQEWKKKHGKVYQITVGDHVGYFKKPDRKIMGAASALGMKDPMKFNETLMINCQIGGSMEIQSDDDLFMSASGVLAELIDIKAAEIKNL